MRVRLRGYAQQREQQQGEAQSIKLKAQGKHQGAKLHGRIREQIPRGTRRERGCVRSTSRSTLECRTAASPFRTVPRLLLRLVRDTAALRTLGLELGPSLEL
ncbi:hypothetical protein LBMAG56_13910 [Verrucomicrobiota bacterium]|nr:hypothetical protein LBMAG56_13910 [Verrucomicrobiota bacterium]